MMGLRSLLGRLFRRRPSRSFVIDPDTDAALDRFLGHIDPIYDEFLGWIGGTVNDATFRGLLPGTVELRWPPKAVPDPWRPGTYRIEYVFVFRPCHHDAIFALAGLNIPADIRCHQCGEALT